MTAMLATRRAPDALKTFPVIEIFGPTIQGEGAEAGLATHFLRVGGCDYRCSWCDTMYAVDPAKVRKTARKLTSDDIVAELDRLPGAPQWVTISGGNPALHRLENVVAALQDRGRLVSVETQGSVWRDWLADVDRLTISPKAPSSGMVTPRHTEQLHDFMAAVTHRAADTAVMKIVCFDETDLAWSKDMTQRWPDLRLFLSAGTPVPAAGPIREAVGDRYRWLCETVSADPLLSHARVLPQLHVIAWKDAVGV